ncbi:MAG TPA: NADPH:quinone reductase [Streptosporangiaceae bacterium]|nr:NADPH:quinone reductase [Streptosporangiaceae bacterium]
MRAALYDHYGPAREVLRVQDVERPEPGPGEVRVKIEASGVNPTDWKSRSGMTPRPIDGFQIPHHDGAGVIDAVGAGVDPGRAGQRVWLWMAAAGRRWGTAAEWTVVPEHAAVPLPDGASADLGASLGVPAITAHRCLFADGPVGGTTVLVAGGAGAVGHFAIELAKRAGARVITTVSGPRKAELAAKAGADLVVNYREPDAADQIRAFAGPGGVDHVVEVALGANLALDLAVLASGGRIVCYAAEATDPVLPVRACMNANVVVRFVLLYGVPPEALAQAARDITAALDAGALTELPVTRFPLEQAAAAQEAVEAGAVGKVLVIPGS